MIDQTWFDNIPIIGALPSEEAAIMLQEIGENEVAEALNATSGPSMHTFGPGTYKHWWTPPDKLWLHTAHAFGYLPPAQAGCDTLSLQPVDAIQAESALKHTRVKITLDRLRVAEYPGKGMHRILLHFFAQNQIPQKKENLHFNATYRVNDGESAAIRGYPIFVGMNVGNEGIRLMCRTINVKNDQDEAFLNILESDVFKNGLQLITTAQPALVPLSELALGLARTIAARHRNISVQDFDLGLDFSTIPMRAHLAEGSYLAVQMPESLQPVWDWDEWVYRPASGLVVKRDDHQQPIPYNYLVFSISRYEGS
jgi:hypothetical protein